jgi:hypothetical protein
MKPSCISLIFKSYFINYETCGIEKRESQSNFGILFYYFEGILFGYPKITLISRGGYNS